MTALRILGKFLISVGAGILLFVLWTLYGTGFYTSGQQRALADELDDIISAVEAEAPQSGTPRQGPPRNFAPGPGEPVFRLQIPAVDVDSVVVEGVGVEELKKGPGHYPECRGGFERPLCTEFDDVYPGEQGRVIVSGHRTTYGAPFWGVDELAEGDVIKAITPWGRFTYRVTRQEVVPPDSKAIVTPGDEAELVLTTCNPRFSAAQRLIVFASLEEPAG